MKLSKETQLKFLHAAIGMVYDRESLIAISNRIKKLEVSKKVIKRNKTEAIEDIRKRQELY